MLRGLTPTETDELERLWRDKGASSDFDEVRFLELSHKHEVERLQAVSAVVQGKRRERT